MGKELPFTVGVEDDQPRLRDIFRTGGAVVIDRGSAWCGQRYAILVP